MASSQRSSPRLAAMAGKEKMFQKLSSAEFTKISKSYLKDFSTTKNKNSRGAKYIEKSQSMMIETTQSITHEKIIKYLKMICDHVNKTSGSHLCETLDQYSNLKPNTIKPGSEFIKTRDEFNKLRYIFFPDRANDFEPMNTAFLIAISPRNKTVEFISSASPKQPGSDWPWNKLIWVWKFINQCLGGDFVPSEWKVRFMISPLENRDSDNNAVFVCTHAMCIAFGYPIGFPINSNLPLDHRRRIEVFHARKERMAFDLQHGKFEMKGKSSDPFFYTVVDRHAQDSGTGGGVLDGFVEVNGSCGMDIKMFARTRRYSDYTWKDLTEWCRAVENAGKYEEHEWWRRHARNLDEFKDAVMERDYLIKIKGFVVGKGLVMWRRSILEDGVESLRKSDGVRRVEGELLPEKVLLFGDLNYRIGVLEEGEVVRVRREKEEKASR